MIIIFTGLIEEIGEILEVREQNKSKLIKIKSNKVIKNAELGASIATNGVCLTATKIGDNYFEADAMNETLKRSSLKNIKVGDKVNLEKSVTLSTPLGGHIVLGDVDCEGMIISIKNDGIAKIYTIEIENKYMKYIVEKGRITLDGASLTVTNFSENTFSVSLIPHTLENIILGYKKEGDSVNVETDLMGKYVDRILNFKDDKSASEEDISIEFLGKHGFL